jgi:hypothetical protein
LGDFGFSTLAFFGVEVARGGTHPHPQFFSLVIAITSFTAVSRACILSLRTGSHTCTVSQNPWAAGIPVVF